MHRGFLFAQILAHGNSAAQRLGMVWLSAMQAATIHWEGKIMKDMIPITCYIVKETRTGWGVLPRDRLKRSRELVWLNKGQSIRDPKTMGRTAVFWIPKLEAADKGLIALFNC